MKYEHAIKDIVPENICENTSGLAKAVSEHNLRINVLRNLFECTGVKPFCELKQLPYLFEDFVSDLLSVRPNIYENDNNNDNNALNNLKKVLSNYDKYYVYVLKELGGIKYRFMPEVILALDTFSYEINNFIVKGSFSQKDKNHIKQIKEYCNELRNGFGPQFSEYWTGDMGKIQAIQIATYANKNEIFPDLFHLTELVIWFKNFKEKLRKNETSVKKEKHYTQSRHTEKVQICKYLDAQAELYELEKMFVQQSAIKDGYQNIQGS